MSAHGPSRFLFYANVINSCSFGISFPIVSDTSLSFFADAGHHAPRMMEVYYGIIARSLLFSLTLVVSLSTSLHVFFSLVEGDNLQQIVQETAQGDF